mmetsp:Transcript_32260/g.63546  ORF Transcript_32260/g.63546 Transcript_32260/m.63546 type:complete len:418 (-) Transcript_32260:487-1740(-)
MTCYKKNNFWSGCRPSCTPGIHAFDPPEHRTPWSCERIDSSHPDCAEDHTDCIHLGCCKNKSHKCFMKDPGEAFCGPSSPKGWLGHVIRPHHLLGDASHPDDLVHGQDLSKHWHGDLHSTHYWDCSGQGCDADHLQPWDKSKYISPPEYAPMDPEKNGGNMYGEKIWMTGATSDAVSDILGPDANGCGSDNGGGGGCGQCLLVKNYQSNNKDWTAVIMRKNRCPPWSTGCEGGKFHMDFAVPGFDNLKYSTANICGKPGTTLSRDQSSICGGVSPKDCNCAQIPTHTAGLRKMREGCELFKKWGWWSGTPTLDWRPIPCPPAFVERVKLGAAFGPKGPVTVSFFDAGNNTGALRSSVASTHGPLTQGLQHWPRTAAAVLLPMLLVLGLVRGVVDLRRRYRPPDDSDDAEDLLPAAHE